MEFLTTALYRQNSAGDEEFSGALVTSIDWENDTARPRVVHQTRDEILATPREELQGFYVEDGILYSDTVCRKVFDAALTDYISREGIIDGALPVGLIDVVLQGGASGAKLLQNASEFRAGTAEKRLVPLSAFRVSKSSFNIYAPYLNDDGVFRTVSLVDIETEDVAPFVLAVPNGGLEIAKTLSSVLSLSDIEPDEDHVYYDVCCKLNGAYTFMGEAFVNYLAFHEAFYTLGLRVLKQFLKDTKYVGGIEEDKPERVRRKPKRNVELVSCFHEVYTSAILSMMAGNDGGMPALKKFISESQEANITWIWINKICQDAKVLEESGEVRGESSINAACLNLLPELRKIIQRYSLELLAQRYYIAQAGFLNDPFPMVLKGGGVDGQTAKRFAG